ncbi:MAG: hypothetical protein HY315_00465 [Acidobacteria bacterium]|nr:hypothetical protein [Acidobacteriota bacterium]
MMGRKNAVLWLLALSSLLPVRLAAQSGDSNTRLLSFPSDGLLQTAAAPLNTHPPVDALSSVPLDNPSFSQMLTPTVVTSSCVDATKDSEVSFQRSTEQEGRVTTWLYRPACFPSYYFKSQHYEGMFLENGRPLPWMGRTHGHFDVLIVLIDTASNRQGLLDNQLIPASVKGRITAGEVRAALQELFATYEMDRIVTGLGFNLGIEQREIVRRLTSVFSFTFTVALTQRPRSDFEGGATTAGSELGFPRYDAVAIIDNLGGPSGLGVQRWPGGRAGDYNLNPRPLFFGKDATFYLFLHPRALSAALFGNELLRRNFPQLPSEYLVGAEKLVPTGPTTFNDETPIVNPRTGENVEPLIRAREGKVHPFHYLAGYLDVDGDNIVDCIDPEITPTPDNVDGDLLPDRFDPDLNFDHTPFRWIYAAAPLNQKTHFAQFGNGANFASSIVLTNPSQTGSAQGLLSFFSDRGQPLAVSLAAKVPVNILSFSIPPLGSATFRTDGIGNLVTGSARVASNIPVAGVVRFSAPGLGIAGVGESAPLTALMTPAVRDLARRLNTGIAISNTLDAIVELFLSLRGLDGREIGGGSATATLAASGHMAKFIDELFPAADTARFQGTLVVTVRTAGGKVAATAIQLGASAGEFTTLPVVPVDPAPTARELFFAHFGDGSTFTSSFFLTNPAASTTRGELSFFDEEGSRLAVSVGGQSPVDRVSFDIQPTGGFIFSTDGQGSLVSGSARTSTDSAIGGVLRFAFPGLGIAGVGAGIPTRGFIIPATRSVARKLSTGVAIASDGAAVRVTLTLRRSNAETVPGGQATLQLKANGHTARFIQELFPGADTAEFEGTLTVTAEGGNVVGTAIQLGSNPGEFTTLPVTALR